MSTSIVESMHTLKMPCLVVRVNNIWQGQDVIDYFNKYSAQAYASSDEKGPTVVLPTHHPLESGREAAMVLGGAAICYGIDANGVKYSLVKKDGEKK